MDVTIVTSAVDDEGRAPLLTLLGMPFRRTDMAKKALIEKSSKEAEVQGAPATRCSRCGRPRSVYRKFGVCRICLREMAHRGELCPASPRAVGN